MSRLLNRLHQELAVAKDGTSRAEILARICCVDARHGRLDDAQRAIDQLRLEFGSGQSGRVTVWMMLAEGLIHHFGNQKLLALDRLSRAQFLAINMKYLPFVGLVSSWKAFVEFGDSKFDAMSHSLRMAIENTDPDDLDALTRISIVASYGYATCGNEEKSRFWFSRGHFFAVKNGDQDSIDALVFNHAVGCIDTLRVDAFLGEVSGDRVRRARAELESAKSLSQLFRSQALVNNLRLTDARLKAIEGDLHTSIGEIDLVRTLAPFNTQQLRQDLIALELCYFRLKLQVQGALSLYFDVDRAMDFDDLDLDDQVVASRIRLELSSIDSRFGNSAMLLQKHEEILSQYLQTYEQTERALSLGINNWVPAISARLGQ